MMIKTQLFSILACCAILPLQAQDAGTVPAGLPTQFGFEDGLQGWVVVEGQLPVPLNTARDTQYHFGTPMAKQGKRFLSTLDDPKGTPSDTYVGCVESPIFILTSAKLDFLIAGGSHPETRLALCSIDGKEVRKAHGRNDQVLRRVEWDAADLVGKPVFLRLVDQHTGGWGHLLLDDVRFQGRIDAEASAKRLAAAQKAGTRNILEKEINLPGLKAMILDLEKTFPGTYTGWSAKLAEFEARMADEKTLEDPKFLEQLQAFRREAMIANPLVGGQPLLYVQRRQYAPDHHNTETMFQKGEICESKFNPPGRLKTIDLKTGEVKVLVDGGPQALTRDPEVHFSGKKIVFSMRNGRDGFYHLYEVNADGSGLKQLTFASNVTDIDPLYLPDDHIVFTATREPKYCMCNRHIMGNLFRMEPDGANIQQIGKSTLFEGHSSLMPDGRVLYDRWEYIDRNFGDAQGLWVVNPDGTRHAIYWGNNTSSPGGVIDGRILPNGLCLCIFGSCHDRPWGALALIDRSQGVDGRAPVLRTWPPEAIKRVEVGGIDSYMAVRPRYEDPFPLSDNYFLAVRDLGQNEEMAIVLLDIFGNELVLHRDAPGCFDPMPLAPRKRPPVLPISRTFDNSPGKFYIQDVYVGTHMQGVKRGDVKFLRVIESGEKRSWTQPAWGGQGTIAPALNWHDFGNKRILGTIPVEADGSAYFECPADSFVYFQLLDQQGRMIQTMRSGTIIQPGEQQGCIGCHENRVNQVPANNNPQALMKPARKLDGWHGPAQFFSFARDVQPVFDAHCVKCHDFGKPAGQKLLLCGDRATVFSASYKDLWRKGEIRCIGGGPAQILQPFAWGAGQSKLIKTLDNGHQKITLTPEEMDRLVSWIDINGPYYSTYDCAYPNTLAGRCPLSNQQLQQLNKLTGINFGGMADHGSNRGALVSFDRPELSPCLAKLAKESPEYQQALAIIQAGQKQLKEKPEADRPCFIPAPYAIERELNYEKRRQVELEIRKAIHEGRKIYDGKPIENGKLKMENGK